MAVRSGTAGRRGAGAAPGRPPAGGAPARVTSRPPAAAHIRRQRAARDALLALKPSTFHAFYKAKPEAGGTPVTSRKASHSSFYLCYTHLPPWPPSTTFN